MSIPSAVIERFQGNTFVAFTGMCVSGVTGFGIRTGIYLTNSGNYPIKTVVSTTDQYPSVFSFPSGTSFDINAGKNKFIPFEVVFAQDNISGPYLDNPTGPETMGNYIQDIYIDSTSAWDGQSDGDGRITLTVTGQVTGFGDKPVGSQGPFTATKPAYPSGFRGVTQYAKSGKPETVLRWYHPTTGYYFTRYQLEYAGNIDTVAGSSSPTGLWSGLATFDINHDTTLIESSFYAGGNFTMKKYATNTGINQLYSMGAEGNRDSNYGEYTAESLGFNADYYYRIKGQHRDRQNDIDHESEYVYSYPVENFNVDITNSDINNGLLSGSTTLPASSSSNIKNSVGSPQALKIFILNGQSDINLKTLFTNALTSRSIDTSAFRSTSANYAFSGVHFIVPQKYEVGASTADEPGITTGGRIEDDAGTEVTTVLALEPYSIIAGHGGKGGDGGFTDLTRNPNAAATLWNEGRINITDRTTTASTDGGDGSAAIYIDTSNIAKFTIRKDASAKIYGGGGGGGGGDPYFWPKAFTLRAQPDTEFDIGRFRRNSGNKGTLINKVGDEYTFSEDKRNTIGFNGANIKGGNSMQYNEEYTLGDILGTQRAGIGGGGQGFGESLGGASLKEGSESIMETQNGTIKAAGLGTTADISIKISPAGNGGAFGVDGEDAYNASAGELYPVDLGDAKPADGGAAGEAIKIIASNSNYSSLSDLVVFKDYLTPNTTNYPHLLAHFNADSGVYKNDAGNSAAGNGENVHVWRSVNDPTNIYMDKTIADMDYGVAPKYFTSTTSYTDAFNNQKMIWFERGGILEINGLVQSGKLTADMDGFEIIYFLAPFYNYSGDVVPTYSPFHKPGNQNGSFRTGLTEFYDKGLRYPTCKGWPLHMWTEERVMPSNSYQKPSLFYNSKGETQEGAGLPLHQQLKFNDFTNLTNPGRAWMYSISAQRDGSTIQYGVYNDLQLMKSHVFGVDSFSWKVKPLIGGSRYHGADTATCFWYGGISDILIFKKSLELKERRAIFNYLANSKLKINSSANKTDATDRNELGTKNGFAGFNIGPSW